VIGRPELGSPDKNVVKRVVHQVKTLAREYALRLGDRVCAFQNHP
jgi:hypothetical protein